MVRVKKLVPARSGSGATTTSTTSSSCWRTAASRSSSSSCTSAPDEQAKRLRERQDDPGEALEVQPRRPRRPQAVARVSWPPTRTRSAAATPAGALVRDPGRPQVVPQPGGLGDPHRHTRGDEAAVPGTDRRRAGVRDSRRARSTRVSAAVPAADAAAAPAADAAAGPAPEAAPAPAAAALIAMSSPRF